MFYGGDAGSIFEQVIVRFVRYAERQHDGIVFDISLLNTLFQVIIARCARWTSR
jgi:hypothetical protein